MVFIAIVFSSMQAQDYKSAVGLRLGYPISATYKTFVNESMAFEGFVGYRSFFGASYINLNAAVQIHQDLELENLEGLQWYYGAGAGYYIWSFDGAGGSFNSVGISGYLGLSYTLKNTPVNFSVDWVPTVLIGGSGIFGSGFTGSSAALAVRYVLGGRE